MRNSRKNKLILFVCFLLTASAGCFQFFKADVIKPFNNNSTNKVSAKSKDLRNNTNWKHLKAIWKKLNHINNRTDFQARYSSYEKVKEENKDIENYLMNLVKAGLISSTEKDFLYKLFAERVGYIQYQIGVVECYKMTLLGNQIVKRREDLENRYDTIEKLFKEGKINTETYSETIKQITEDLKFIADNSDYQDNKISDKSLIDLVVNLNK